MEYRKKIILALLETVDKDVTAIAFQKILFLLTRTMRSKELYSFVPYKYGCFSFTANHDICTLSNKGYLTITKNGTESLYHLLHKDNYSVDLDMFDAMHIKRICDEFKDYSQRDLIVYTYKKYPFTAINSVIAKDVLDADEYKMVEKHKCGLTKTDRVLFTIGYEGMSLETYLRLLISNDVHLLCDVRRNAYSMKYGFSKAVLQKACAGIGIQYVHVPSLGIDSKLRVNLDTQEDYDRLFDIYERTTLKDNSDALMYVHSLIEEYGRVCLTCFEKDPRQCHRTRVANALMNLENVTYKYEPILL